MVSLEAFHFPRLDTVFTLAQECKRLKRVTCPVLRIKPLMASGWGKKVESSLQVPSRFRGGAAAVKTQCRLGDQAAYKSHKKITNGQGGEVYLNTFSPAKLQFGVDSSDTRNQDRGGQSLVCSSPSTKMVLAVELDWWSWPRVMSAFMLRPFRKGQFRISWPPWALSGPTHQTGQTVDLVFCSQSGVWLFEGGRSTNHSPAMAKPTGILNVLSCRTGVGRDLPDESTPGDGFQTDVWRLNRISQ